MLSCPELTCNWPLGAITNPNSDDDESTENMLDEGEQDIEDED